MNTETTKLIEQLAVKLGTTSEYLWSILIKQAPISATIDLLLLILIIIGGVTLYKLNKHFANRGNTMCYYSSESLTIAMIVGTSIWIVFAIPSVLLIDNIIQGYFNPEFWAVNYIFDAIQ